MVVAVKENEIAAPQHRIGNDLVGCARAVQNEIGLIGTKNPRRMTLCFCRRAFVDEEVSEIHVGVAQIVAEDALAEILKEKLPGGRFAVELAALMSGAIKGNIRLAVIRHQALRRRAARGSCRT